MLIAAAGLFLVMPSAASATSGSDWLPLTGSDIQVGCTWNNGCAGGYHYDSGKALDFMVPVNRPVYASGAGTITIADGGCPPYTRSDGCNGGAGNYIQISHGSHVSRYLHLSSFAQTSGAVSAGQLIGYTGLSGWTEEPHLHYDEKVGATKVDPGTLLACHGATRIAYPAAAGAASWTGIPHHGPGRLRNDGYGCTVPVGDGGFIRTPNGNVYRIVGGAPIHVHSCASLNGCPGTLYVADLSGYRAVPRNGTFVRKVDGLGAGTIARVAGGHLIGLATCAPGGIDGCPDSINIDGGGWDAYAAAHPRVANGAFVRKANGPGAGTIARAAGGHLIALASCAPAGIDGCPETVNVDHTGWTNYTAAHPHVANGAFVRVANGSAAGLVARAAGGALLGLTDCTPLGGCGGYVNVDEFGFARYRETHLRSRDGTVLKGMPSGELWRLEGGLRYRAESETGAVAVNDATIAGIPRGPSDSGPKQPEAPPQITGPTPGPSALPVAPATAGTRLVAPRRASKGRLRRGLRIHIRALTPGSVARAQLRHGKRILARAQVAANADGAATITLRVRRKKLAIVRRGARLTLSVHARWIDTDLGSMTRRLRIGAPRA